MPHLVGAICFRTRSGLATSGAGNADGEPLLVDADGLMGEVMHEGDREKLADISRKQEKKEVRRPRALAPARPRVRPSACRVARARRGR